MPLYTIYILTFNYEEGDADVKFYYFNKEYAELAKKIYAKEIKNASIETIETPLASKIHQTAIKDTQDLKYDPNLNEILV